MRILVCFWFLLAGCMQVQAQEIEGVMVQETVVADDGTELLLNGAGVRTKFFFDIYVAELYMVHPATSAEQVIGSGGHKRIVMNFLHKKVERDQLVEAWNDGFTGNTPPADLPALQPRIDQFNGFFGDAVAGDMIVLDYVPEMGTTVFVNKEKRGTIPGKDFNDALLRIWLGDKPVTKDLKQALLGG